MASDDISKELHSYHAVFASMFVCEDCERVMFGSKQVEFTEPWFRELGEAGRKAGWYVPPICPEGVDVYSALVSGMRYQERMGFMR